MNENHITIAEEHNHLSDEILVEMISISNDTVLFGVLYDRYEHVVYNKCYGFVFSVDEAKDLTQDVFLHVFVKLKTFKGNSKFSTWLYSVTYNFCVNYLNRDKERKISAYSDQVENNNRLTIEVNEYSLFQMKSDRLEKALLLIPPEDKMILQLKYQDDISIKELQNTLHISESAIKMRLSRAKTRLADEYNKLET
jgi:RNA polymerase sigma factor (sigma-70 family)